MNFDYCVIEAAQRALEMEGVPDELLPMVIISEIHHASALESEAMGCSVWH